MTAVRSMVPSDRADSVAAVARAVALPAAIGVVVAHLTLADAPLPLATALVAAVAVLASSFNVLGRDAEALPNLIERGVDLRGVLRAAVIAPLVVLLPLVLVFVLLEAALGGAWGDVVAALLTGAGVVAAGLGMGALASVANPHPASRRGSGLSLSTLLWAFGFVAVVGVGALVWAIASGIGLEVGAGIGATVVTALLARVATGRAGRLLADDPWAVVDALRNEPGSG